MKKLANISFVMITPLFAVAFACFGCGKENNMEYTSPINSTGTPAVPTTTGLQYLALGDSYTIGQSVAESGRFPAQTVLLLAKDSISIQPVKYIATTGWTTANLMDAINSEQPAQNYDIVTLLIGVNDQYQHMDTAGYRTRFTALLNRAVLLAADRPSRVFVLSIPDYSATPFVAESGKERVSKEVDQFNMINKQVTLDNHIAYIDITPTSKEAATNPGFTANDGLHPSATQYARWAALLAPAIKKALK